MNSENPRIGIVSVGDELLEGIMMDSNSRYMACELTKIGCKVVRVIQVKDDVEEISEVISYLLKISDVIITSGGLGPTEDDLTREGVAKALKKSLAMDENVLNQINEKLKESGIYKLDNVKKQAMVIENAKVLKNEIGTAPGQFLEFNGKMIFLLPGPPIELTPMFKKYVVPTLKSKVRENYVIRTYRFFGIKEAVLEEKLKDFLYSDEDVKVSILIDACIGPTVRLMTLKRHSWKIERMEKLMKERLGKYLYTIGEKKIDEVIVDELMKREITISVAESCTGGLLASTLINFPNISRIFKGGMVTYSVHSKLKLLGVNEKIIEKYGVVSEEMAIEMASKVREKFETDMGIGITGIAGPSGGSKKKPIGLVYTGVNFKDRIISRKNVFDGDRNTIRKKAVYSTFDLLRKIII